jgi:hypothetical protein
VATAQLFIKSEKTRQRFAINENVKKECNTATILEKT